MAFRDVLAVLLYYYRARYYSPQLGRFLQTDPVGYASDVDLYTYVYNDPADKTDPTGNQEVPEEKEESEVDVVGELTNGYAGELIADINKLEPQGYSEAHATGYQYTGADIQRLQQLRTTAKANADGTITDSTGRTRTGSSDGPGAGARISPSTRAAERTASNDTCSYCGGPTTNVPGRPNSSVGDHLQPRAGDRAGGPRGNNSAENTVNACAACNTAKSNHPFWDWVRNTFGMSGN